MIYLQSVSPINSTMADRAKRGNEESTKIWVSQEWKEIFW